MLHGGMCADRRLWTGLGAYKGRAGSCGPALPPKGHQVSTTVRTCTPLALWRPVKLTLSSLQHCRLHRHEGGRYGGAFLRQTRWDAGGAAYAYVNGALFNGEEVEKACTGKGSHRAASLRSRALIGRSSNLFLRPAVNVWTGRRLPCMYPLATRTAQLMLTLETHVAARQARAVSELWRRGGKAAIVSARTAGLARVDPVLQPRRSRARGCHCQGGRGENGGSAAIRQLRRGGRGRIRKSRDHRIVNTSFHRFAVLHNPQFVPRSRNLGPR